MQESSLKTNFLGRDGFRWWIGHIPPESAHGTQINGGGWGNRYKVRIMGYHPYDTRELPDKDLPWAQCLLPTTAGTGAGNNATTIKISPGDVVFGFFLDTDNAQTPVIMGCFGRTSQVLTSESAGPFKPFTGYTNKVVKPNGITDVKPDQTNEQNANSQKSPRHVSPEQARRIDSDEISYFSAIGDKIQLANTVNNTTVNKISTEVGNLINKIKSPAIFTNIKNEVNRVTDKIQAIANGLVGNMVNGLYEKLIPLLNKGLDLLYKQVYAIVYAITQSHPPAHLAGVAAQTAMVPPVNILQKAIPCVSGAIVSGLGSVVKEILKSVVDNVENFISCAANQFTGALINDIIGKISNGLESALNGVQKLLQFFSSFSVEGFLRNSVDSIKGIVGMFDCNQSKGKANGIVEQWIIGQGYSDMPAPSFRKILENANLAKAIGEISYSEKITPSDQIVLDNVFSSVISPVKIGRNSNRITLLSLTGITTGAFITSGSEIMEVNRFNSSTNEVVVTRGYSGIATNYDAGSSFYVINNVPKESLTKQVLPSTFEQKYGVFDIFSSKTKDRKKSKGCYTGPPSFCGAPTINIFGGGGSKSTAIPLLGSIIEGTGSIIGVKVTNRGSGYKFPPFVEIVDNCNQGYGAVARSIINDAGEVESIYIVSEGENYPTGDVYENTSVINSSTETQTNSLVARNYIVKDVLIQNPGQNYSQTDTASDQFGNQYSIEVFEGSINKIQPINTDITGNIGDNITDNITGNTGNIITGRTNVNTVVVDDLPIITIKSETGSGALLRPILDIESAEFQGEVLQVIDCVT